MLILSIETSCDETSLAFLTNNFSQDNFSQSSCQAKPESDSSENQSKASQNPENLAAYLNSFQVLGQVISSQIDIHQEFGGVIPEIGARAHASQIHFLFKQVLQTSQQKYLDLAKKDDSTINSSKSNSNQKNSNKTPKSVDKPLHLLSNLDYILVTTTPGLVSALRVGLEFAKTLQFFIDKKYQKSVKLRPVNHLQGHLASCFWQNQS